MSGLKPIGSEKLEGDAKVRRIMEIARFGETTRNKSLYQKRCGRTNLLYSIRT